MRHLNGWGIGKFTVSGKTWMGAEPDFLLLMFSGMVPVRIDNSFPDDAIHYVAYSPKFRAVPEGDVIPEYEFWFDREEKSVKVREVGDPSGEFEKWERFKCLVGDSANRGEG